MWWNELLGVREFLELGWVQCEPIGSFGEDHDPSGSDGSRHGSIGLIDRKVSLDGGHIRFRGKEGKKCGMSKADADAIKFGSDVWKPIQCAPAHPPWLFSHPRPNQAHLSSRVHDREHALLFHKDDSLSMQRSRSMRIRSQWKLGTTSSCTRTSSRRVRRI
jgi:hypothetical protein